jgi:hypothetical protein
MKRVKAVNSFRNGIVVGINRNFECKVSIREIKMLPDGGVVVPFLYILLFRKVIG